MPSRNAHVYSGLASVDVGVLGGHMLRYGVLGLLIERRGYGYELVQRLAARLGSSWQLNRGSVYTALDQLLAAGLIEVVSDGSEALEDHDRVNAPGMSQAGLRDGRAERRSVGKPGTARRSARVIYGATERGVGEFNAWLARPLRRVEPIRSELALKIALAAPENVPPLLASIAHAERLIARSLQVERRDTASGRDSDGWPLAASSFVSAAAAGHLQCELDWLAAVRETLQHMLGENFTASLG